MVKNPSGINVIVSYDALQQPIVKGLPEGYDVKFIYRERPPSEILYLCISRNPLSPESGYIRRAKHACRNFLLGKKEKYLFTGRPTNMPMREIENPQFMPPEGSESAIHFIVGESEAWLFPQKTGDGSLKCGGKEIPLERLV